MRRGLPWISGRCMASLAGVLSGTRSIGSSAAASSAPSASGWAATLPCGSAPARAAFYANGMGSWAACSPSRNPAFTPLQIASSSGSHVARSPISPLDVRHYAKAAPAKGGDAAGSKRHRRSTTRLFSCRNDRFRSAFEQIWPTLRLTEAEQGLFKRNSRLFVVETGKAISLKQKFNISRPAPAPFTVIMPLHPSLSSEAGADSGSRDAAMLPVAPPPLKPHYAEARSALFESDLHLDAAGEHPRYLKIRKIRTQFGVRLQNTRKVRLLLGFVRRGYLQKLYEQTQVQPGASKVWKLVCALESRLAMFALRMGLAHDILAANVVLRRKVYLNGTPPPLKQACFVQPGDVVSPAPDGLSAYKSSLAGEMGPLMRDVHRDFLL